MSANSWGNFFKLTSFGESHGVALGAVIEGCPSGVRFDESTLKKWMERRRPGGELVSGRAEADEPEILSGVFENKTLGTPITIIVRNKDARPSDYLKIKDNPRVGHADDVWQNKFGHVDHRGGGRSSGRETLSRCIGGAIAEMFLSQTMPQTKIMGTICRIGNIEILEDDVAWGETRYNLRKAKFQEIEKYLLGLKAEGESVGGVAEVRIIAPPQGLGQPVFHKLKSDLTAAYMSIGATVGVELGGGFSLSEMKGSELHSKSENALYGGIRGGISTGENISCKIAFKPTSSILDVAKKGRHDPCIVLRALPVLEAMTYLVLADHVLWARMDQI